jgi:hypothetical protein
MKLYLELQNWSGGILCNSESFNEDDFEAFTKEIKKLWPVSVSDTISVRRADD